MNIQIIAEPDATGDNEASGRNLRYVAFVLFGVRFEISREADQNQALYAMASIQSGLAKCAVCRDEMLRQWRKYAICAFMVGFAVGAIITTTL